MKVISQVQGSLLWCHRLSCHQPNRISSKLTVPSLTISFLSTSTTVTCYPLWRRPRFRTTQGYLRRASLLAFILDICQQGGLISERPVPFKRRAYFNFFNFFDVSLLEFSRPNRFTEEAASAGRVKNVACVAVIELFQAIADISYQYSKGIWYCS